MAEVPYNQGVPTVTPRESVPDDYQRINPNPEEFGGAIAKGEQQLGAGASAAAKFFGQVQTDDAANTALTEANGHLNTFRALRGADALRAQQSTQDAIDAAFKKGRDSLTSPEQQYQYDTITRNYQQRYISGIMASHADEEAKAYASKTNTDAFTTAVNSVAGVADRPDMVAGFQHDARAAAIKQLQVEGNENDPDARANAIRRADQAVAIEQIRAIAVNDPARAQRMVENYKGILGDKYYELSSSVRERADTQTANGVASQSVTAATLAHPFNNPALPVYRDTATANPNGFSSWGLGRTIQIESGGDPDASNGEHQGLGQLSKAVQKEYGVTDPNNPKQNIEATQRYAAANRPILQLGLNRMPTDAELYLAHQQGAFGALKLLQNPTVRAGNLVGDDHIRQNGGDPNAPASAFTAMWTQRFNNPSVSLEPATMPFDQNASPRSVKADAYTRILQNPNLSPEVRDKALRLVSTQLAAQSIAQDADDKAAKQLVEQTADEYTKLIHSGQMTTAMMAKLITDQRLNSDWKTRDALITIARTQSGSDIAGASMQYGPGFWNAYKSIVAPVGDPNRITDPLALLNRAGPGGDLTLAGVEKLKSVMGSVQKSVDDSNVQKALVSVIDGAKDQLSFDGTVMAPGLPPLRDFKGKQIYENQFVPEYMQMFDKWVKDGKDPFEFLNDQKRRDDMITRLRPKNQMAMDRVSAEGDATGDKGQQEAIPVAPQGIADTAWQGVMATRPIMANGQPLPPQNWNRALDILRANPTAEGIRVFNDHWKGFDGAAILKQLGGPAAPAEKAPAAVAAPAEKAPAAVAAPAVPIKVSAPEPDLATEAATGMAQAEALEKQGRERQGALAQITREREARILQ